MRSDSTAHELIGDEFACTHDFEPACEHCHLRRMCLPAALDNHHLDALNNIIDHCRDLRANETIYRQQQSFSSLYATLSGSVKIHIAQSDGSFNIIGCRLPGEVFGFSAIDTGHYRSTATALEDTRVCEIPFGQLTELCRHVPDLQSRLFHLMSRRLVEDHEMAAQFLHKRPVAARLAIFLLSLATRARRRGAPVGILRLPMSRTDIANYLGMTLETLSRELTTLQKNGVITLKQRQWEILDLEQLRQPLCNNSSR